MRRRRLLAVATTAAGGIAGCTKRARESGGGSPTATATSGGTPTDTPACTDSTYDDEEGELELEFGYETTDGKTYEATLRIVHVSTPVCRYRSTPCDDTPTEHVVTEKTLYVSGDTGYGVVPLPLSAAVDKYRVTFAVSGKTSKSVALEQAARSLVGERYDFYVCNPGVRRLGFVIEDGEPRIVDV